MQLSNVITGLVVGGVIVLLVAFLKPPVDRYEIAEVGVQTVRLDTRNGAIEKCEYTLDDREEYLCGADLATWYNRNSGDQ